MRNAILIATLLIIGCGGTDRPNGTIEPADNNINGSIDGFALNVKSARFDGDATRLNIYLSDTPHNVL